MRELARGNTIDECQKHIDRLKVQGYEPLTEIKLDDSLITYNIIRYVCVMENKDMQPDYRFNRRRPQW